MKNMLARLVGTLLLIAPLQSWAATCTVSAQTVAFGNYDPLSVSPTDSTGQVSVTCTNTVSLLLSYTVSLSTGTSGSYSSRQLASGSNRLNYNLYTDATRLLVWGDGTGGSSVVSNTFLVVLLGITANHTVYGRVPTRQNIAVGSYSDTITVTVTY